LNDENAQPIGCVTKARKSAIFGGNGGGKVQEVTVLARTCVTSPCKHSGEGFRRWERA
jgi:hypothetical protein